MSSVVRFRDAVSRAKAHEEAKSDPGPRRAKTSKALRMLGAEDRVEHLTDGKVGRKGALSADEEQIERAVSFAAERLGAPAPTTPQQDDGSGRDSPKSEPTRTSSKALRLLGASGEDVQIELSVQKAKARLDARKARLSSSTQSSVGSERSIGSEQSIGSEAQVEPAGAAVRRLDFDHDDHHDSSRAGSTSADAAVAATEDELRAYVGRHWLVLSNEREAAINGRVGECVGFSHCEGLLHVRVPGERQLLRLTPASVAEPPADATLAAIAAAPAAASVLAAARDALDGALACVAADRPDTVHRGERVRLAVEALGRGDEMEVALRCGEAGEVAEAAADGTLTAAFLAMRPTCQGDGTFRLHTLLHRFDAGPHRAARRLAEFVKMGYCVQCQIEYLESQELSRSGGDSPWDSPWDSPELDPDLDVDHDMMRYLDLMDIRSRIGDEGFVSPSEDWDGLPRVRCENLERLRRAIDESDV